MDRRKAQKTVKLYDHMGRPWKEKEPKVKSAKWMRRLYYKGPARVGQYDDLGKKVDDPMGIREELVRAQVPYCVTLLVYDSKLQVEPTRREYFVYAPLEVQKAAEMAMRLWQRWEKPPRTEEFIFGDMRDVFPKVEDGIVAQPIDDSDYDAHWRSVRSRPHKAAGNPEDPFAFTCLDQDVMAFKTADFQEGLDVKIQ